MSPPMRRWYCCWSKGVGSEVMANRSGVDGTGEGGIVSMPALARSLRM